MPLLTPRQMAEMDRRTIDELGVPGLVLMETAATACVQAVLERWSEQAAQRGVLVLCGPGNNGGDGLAIARRLACLGIEAEALLTRAPDQLDGDARRQLELAQAVDVPVHAPDADLPFDAFGVVVDALFGTGLDREVTGVAGAYIRAANDAGLPLLAVDIPSGVDGRTGRVLGRACRADVTVTFGAPKIGHFTEPGASQRGELVVADIGIPIARWPDVVEDAPRLIDASVLASLAPREAAAHKGTFGHLLVVAGGPGKVGAARLCCEAALRAGAGLVTLALPRGVPVDSLANLRPEVMVERIAAGEGGFDESSLDPILALAATRDAVAVGPGVGTSDGARTFITALLRALQIPSVVDADGLNVMVGSPWPATGARVVTPHPGEASRLLGSSSGEVQSDRLGSVRALQILTHSVAVLKGAGTLVGRVEDTLLNPTGNPGMGTAGSGDVLTGVIGALLARGLSPEEAAPAGVFWHGLAGDRAAEQLGEPSVLASDIAEALGAALAAAEHTPPPFLALPSGWRAW
ncbi:MAG: NAD(P)H-hydrate dehydratase [Deltaproteobacteria bacterium]|nr:NAD(P)H-hydrate dehydratase [Deltaproteobacteria bacterium]